MGPEKKFEYQSTQVKNMFTVVEHISLTPNSLSIYNRFYLNGVREKLDISDSLKKELASMGLADIATQQKIRNSVSHNFQLSKQAQKNLREKVNWLYYFAKKKTIITRKGKILTNFKMNFVTLKLPSEQIHTSDFITKNCLNQLLTEIGKKYDFKNYVWRLEYQKNGNLHYHIATDTYIDYNFLLKTWNRILNKYGYVDLYTRKFSNMSLSDYSKAQNYDGKTDFKLLHERYVKGCREGWKNPNSVDVKAVFGKNNIAFYISKYMAKKATDEENIKLPVCENNSSNSRLWFCSRSLSACKKFSDFREALPVDIYGILKNDPSVTLFIHDYCMTLYFSFDKLTAISKMAIRDLLSNYQKEVNYLPV